MQLSEQFTKKMRGDVPKLKLALELNLSYGTITRWLSKDPEKFATLKVLEAVKKVTGLNQSQVFKS